MKCLFFFLWFCLPFAVPAQHPQINFIYILADDLGYSELGCYGNTFNETPELDKMAKEGMRFTHFYAAAPVCSPYRAALMTGQYPARLGITDYLRPAAAEHLDTRLTTLAELFKEQGYRTGIVGKWHLSGYKNEGAPVESLPEKHGFDEVLVSENRGIALGTYFHPYHFNREIKKKLKDRHEYLTDRQNQEAVEFIERNRERPFFLFLSHYAVHTTLHGKPEIVDHFRAKKNAGVSFPSRNNTENDPYKKWPADANAAKNNPHLAAQLKSIDDGVGQLLDKLYELGLDKNTVIVFTSDNGGETTVTTNFPLKGGKSMLYEGGIRELFIIWGPGLIKAGSIANEPLVNYDIYPTFKELIKNNKKYQQIDGISFAGLLKNPRMKMPGRKLYWHYPLDKPHFLGGRSSGAIRDGDWKLIEFFDDNHVELYNLKNDPYEQTDLSGRYPNKALSLKTSLKKWRNTVHAKQ